MFATSVTAPVATSLKVSGLEPAKVMVPPSSSEFARVAPVAEPAWPREIPPPVASEPASRLIVPLPNDELPPMTTVGVLVAPTVVPPEYELFPASSNVPGASDAQRPWTTRPIADRVCQVDTARDVVRQ